MGRSDFKSQGNNYSNNNSITQDFLRQNYTQSNTAGRAVSAYLINNGGKAGIAAPRAPAASPGRGSSKSAANAHATDNYVDLVDWR